MTDIPNDRPHLVVIGQLLPWKDAALCVDADVLGALDGEDLRCVDRLIGGQRNSDE